MHHLLHRGMTVFQLQIVLKNTRASDFCLMLDHVRVINFLLLLIIMSTILFKVCCCPHSHTANLTLLTSPRFCRLQDVLFGSFGSDLEKTVYGSF